MVKIIDFEYICKAYICNEIDYNILQECPEYLSIVNAEKLEKNQIEELYSFIKEKVDDSSKFIKMYISILPSDTSNLFTSGINRYLKKQDSIEDDIFLYIMNNDSEDLARFKAFYTLFTFHHDKSDSSFCRRIVELSKGLNKFPLWNYAYSVILKDNNNENDMKLALAFAQKCIDIYVQNTKYDEDYPGIFHNYAELVYFSYDRKYSFVNNDNQYYDKAMEYINKSIIIDHMYAKYYYTKGRLLSVR